MKQNQWELQIIVHNQQSAILRHFTNYLLILLIRRIFIRQEKLFYVLAELVLHL